MTPTSAIFGSLLVVSFLFLYVTCRDLGCPSVTDNTTTIVVSEHHGKYIWFHSDAIVRHSFSGHPDSRICNNNVKAELSSTIIHWKLQSLLFRDSTGKVYKGEVCPPNTPYFTLSAPGHETKIIHCGGIGNSDFFDQTFKTNAVTVQIHVPPGSDIYLHSKITFYAREKTWTHLRELGCPPVTDNTTTTVVSEHHGHSWLLHTDAMVRSSFNGHPESRICRYNVKTELSSTILHWKLESELFTDGKKVYQDEFCPPHTPQIKLSAPGHDTKTIHCGGIDYIDFLDNTFQTNTITVEMHVPPGSNIYLRAKITFYARDSTVIHAAPQPANYEKPSTEPPYRHVGNGSGRIGSSLLLDIKLGWMLVVFACLSVAGI